MPRPNRSISVAALAAFLLVAAVASEAGPWGSIGSFNSFESAQRVETVVAEALSESPRTLGVDMPGAAAFQVVRGPHGDAVAANERARHAKSLGYADEMDELAPGARAPQRSSTIKPTQEPALEAPPGYALHKLRRSAERGENADGTGEAEALSEGEGANAICKLSGRLPSVKSCDER